MKFLHNISRVEALSDGVFAFAATLLAVSLDNGETNTALFIDFVSFISFFVSFFVLLLLWKAHYNFFRRTSYMDNMLIGSNAVFLFAVLYFIFPLKSLLFSMFRQFAVTRESLAQLFELYGFAIMLLFTSLSLMYYWAYKKDVENPDRLKLFYYSRHFSIFILISFVSIMLSFLNIGLSFGLPGLIYSLLGPLCAGYGIWFKRQMIKKTN